MPVLKDNVMAENHESEKKPPLITVGVSAFNRKAYLEESLRSLECQTFRDFEIIVVDDGSTDSSPEILASYAQRDERLLILTQECRGAGAARNNGLSIARGTYLSFLDSDDFFEPEMLEISADAMDSTEADVAVFPATLANDAFPVSRPAPWTFVEDAIPKSTPFSWKDMPDRIFNSFGNYTWNKLFRASMIKANNITFQEISRTNDLLFTCCALVAARSIVPIDKTLAHYRVSNSSSLQATKDRDPLAFFPAFSALRKYLLRTGIYQQTEQSFLNHALDGVVSNVESMKTLEGFRLVMKTVRETIEPEFSFLAHEDTYFYDRTELSLYKGLLAGDCADYLFERFRATKSDRDRTLWVVADLRRQVRELETALDNVRSSKSYNLGVALTSPGRLVKSWLQG